MVFASSDDTSFTEDMITWKVPRVLTPLVSATPIKDLNVQMGIDGQKLNPETVEEREYKLDVGPNLITVQIPVGADGGYYKVCKNGIFSSPSPPNLNNQPNYLFLEPCVEQNIWNYVLY